MTASSYDSVFFDDALGIFARLVVRHLGDDALGGNRFVRDIDGRLSLLLLDPVATVAFEKLAVEATDALGAFAASPVVETRSGLFDPSLATDFAIGEKVNVGSSDSRSWRRVAVVDRRVVGQDWAYGRPGAIANAPRVVTFHSIKGGVGRTTALAVAASAQAEKGRNVLIVDLDLEAPGVGTLLLPRDALPDFGALDWLVETNLRPEQGDRLMSRCAAESPLTAGRGAVDVLPALGRTSQEAAWGVVPKIGRALVDHPQSGCSFLERVRHLVKTACSCGPHDYDVVMVDARAGLAESSAAALIGLGAENLCFGVDTPATHDGYRFLFSYLQGLAGTPAPADDDAHWCSKFRIVHAKAQPGAEARQAFRDRVYEVFVDEVYDSDDGAEDFSSMPFSFDYDDDEAPHWPWPIAFDAAFSEFDPRSHPDQLTSAFADRAFGPFLSRLDGLIASPSVHGTP